MERKITIKSIAKEAGVSIATVSNVLNGSGRVSEETAVKVRKVMERRNYFPSNSARNLRSGKSHLIALIVPFMDKTTIHDTPFYWELITGIESGVRDHNFHMLISGLEKNEDVSFVRDHNLDGVIVLGTSDDSPIIKQLKAMAIPSVYLDSYLSDDSLYQVHQDDWMGGYLAMKHLIGLGHQRVVLITDLLREYGVNYERLSGFRAAMEEHGLAYDPELVLEAGLSFHGGYYSAQRIFQHPKSPTAVFALSDVAAIGLVKGLRELGVDVPGALSVMGFDDIRYTQFSSLPLTTIKQNIMKKGQMAVSLLLDQIEGIQHGKRNLVFPVSLEVRQSTGRVNVRLDA